MAGDKLGHYETIALIGKGGMGEVYRAHDTKLKRDVALKVLPDAFARDPARMARFQREAEVLASLNHPNIAHLYGLEERALVMELVEGQTLPCPLPVQTAIDYARQIAEALEYAHEKGVVHRDLKPANIKITPEGVVKVLDFGLAKAIDDPLSSADPSDSPTLTMGATRVGMILGTAAYMSPEQASGHQADRRADIWSFGAVLYEMLAGKKAFPGESVSDTLATVLKLDPNWDALPAQTPVSIRKLVRRCLTKDRKQRLQAVGEARIALESPNRDEPAPASAPLHSRLGRIALAATATFALALAALAFVHFREKPPEAEVVRFEIGPPATVTSLAALPNVSPDGRKVAFFALVGTARRLWVRSLDTREARPLDVTFGAGLQGVVTLWSPDSRWLVFANARELSKIDITGGPSLPVCNLDEGFGGGLWTPDNTIVFGTRTGLRQVPAAGGASVPLTTLDHSRGETFHGYPSLLPDGRHFLYSRSSGPGGLNVYLGSLDAKPEAQSTKVVLAGVGPSVVYAPSPEDNGYLLFVRPANFQSGLLSGTLMAQPFNARKLELAGEAVPVPVAEQVESFSVSATGVLVYQTTASFVVREANLNWYDRKGVVPGMAAEPAPYGNSVLSPDGTQLAYARLSDGGPGRNDIWLHVFASGVSNQFTFGPGTDFPVWSPDGSQIVFSRNSGTGGESGLYRKAANGAGDETLLLKWPRLIRPTSWSRDGFLLFDSASDDPKKGEEVWALPMGGPDGGKDNATRKPILIMSTASSARNANATFSPNGKWITYTFGPSRVGGPVYVRPFDPASPEKNSSGEQHSVAPESTTRVYWRGNELLYGTVDGNVMALAVTTTPVFNPVAAAKSIFKLPAGQNLRDVTVDGKRFLVSVPAGGATPTPQATPYSVVLNWTALLKK